MCKGRFNKLSVNPYFSSVIHLWFLVFNSSSWFPSEILNFLQSTVLHAPLCISNTCVIVQPCKAIIWLCFVMSVMNCPFTGWPCANGYRIRNTLKFITSIFLDLAGGTQTYLKQLLNCNQI